MIPGFARQVRDAAIMGCVMSVGRGDSKELSLDAIRWIRERVERVTPTSLCEGIGFSVFEAHRIIKALCAQNAIGECTKVSRRTGGKEGAYAWHIGLPAKREEPVKKADPSKHTDPLLFVFGEPVDPMNFAARRARRPTPQRKREPARAPAISEHQLQLAFAF